MSRRMWFLAASAWVAVVMAGSLLTWLAIDRAGQQVTGSAAATQAPVVGTVGPPPVSSSAPAPGTTGESPGSSSGPAVTGAPTTRPSPAHSTPTPGHTPSASATTKGPGTTTTQAPPAPHTETRTWSGTPGFVTVSCTGTQAVRKGASPSDGWTFEAGDASGDSVEVTFRNGDTEVQVHATCAGGVPQFSVESSGGGNDH